jgi:methylase of polypeptide subunit release factors
VSTSVVLIVILCIVGFFVFLQIAVRLLRKTVHFPAPAFIGRLLDSNYRRAMQRPETIVRRSGFRPGMKAIEIGCGSGCYTLFTASAVGRSGKIYALDVQRAMLDQLARKIERRRDEYLGNVELLEASAYDIPPRTIRSISPTSSPCSRRSRTNGKPWPRRAGS